MRKTGLRLERLSLQPPREDAREAAWRAFRRERGLSHSRVRELVVRMFLRSEGHVSLAELQALTRRGQQRVALATIYRTMKLLEEAGLAERRAFYGEVTRFEPRREKAHHHDHMICRACGEILEFESEELEQLQERIAGAHGFRIEMHRHELYGVCRFCQADGTSSPMHSAYKQDEADGASPHLRGNEQ